MRTIRVEVVVEERFKHVLPETLAIALIVLADIHASIVESDGDRSPPDLIELRSRPELLPCFAGVERVVTAHSQSPGPRSGGIVKGRKGKKSILRRDRDVRHTS